MNNLIETKNKLLIYKLVKNHFSLNEQSLSLFKEKLFFSPSIAKEYLKFLGSDLRLRVPIDDLSLFEKSDAGWLHLKENLPDFINKNNITYEQFRNNLFLIKNKKLKFKKAIFEYFYDEENFENPFFIKELLILYPSILREYKIHCTWFLEKMILSYQDTKISNSYLLKNLVNYKDSINFKEKMEKGFEYFSNTIGSLKISNKPLQLVLSCNFADWFLASTGETWESCISLESTYDTCQWAGLPGLITDKNRALLYLTDGTKKNYLGIETDKIISRSWLLLARNGVRKKSKTYIHFVGEYPSDTEILDEFAQKFIFKEDYEIHTKDEKWNGRSRYYFEMLFHKHKKKKINFLSYIFSDTSIIKIGKKSKCKNQKNTYAYHFFDLEESGKTHIVLENNIYKKYEHVHFSYENGLKCLVKNKQEIIDFLYREW